jgi:branched-subunit amino acid permease
MVCGFGAVAVFGYVMGIQTAHSWHPFSDMAVQTAVGCIVLGIGVIVAARRQVDVVALEVSPWPAVLVGVCVTTATIGL